MDKVTRIGVSLEPDLLEQFDVHISGMGYVSRSEAIRDLIRSTLSDNEWKDDEQHMVGAITLVFDSHVTGVLERLGKKQTELSETVLASNRVALDDGKFMDIITVAGRLGDLKALKNEYTTLKGVLRGKLTMVSPSKGHMHYIGSNN